MDFFPHNFQYIIFILCQIPIYQSFGSLLQTKGVCLNPGPQLSPSCPFTLLGWESSKAPMEWDKFSVIGEEKEKGMNSTFPSLGFAIPCTAELPPWSRLGQTDVFVSPAPCPPQFSPLDSVV